MKDETFKAWELQDNKNRPVARMMGTAGLRQMGVVLPETLPSSLPMLFASAEIAEEVMQMSREFRGMRAVQVTCDTRLRAFVMVEAVTEEDVSMCIYYKDKSKRWQSLPLRKPK